MSPDQKSIAIAKILKRTIQERLDRETAIYEKLKEVSDNAGKNTGFLVDESAVKEKKKELSANAKNQLEIVEMLKADIKNLDKCITEK